MNGEFNTDDLSANLENLLVLLVDRQTKLL